MYTSQCTVFLMTCYKILKWYPVFQSFVDTQHLKGPSSSLTARTRDSREDNLLWKKPNLLSLCSREDGDNFPWLHVSSDKFLLTALEVRGDS